MTPTECVKLVALMNARIPSMRLDESTPDGWYIDLQHHTFEDGYRAVVETSREKPYVALCDLIDRLNEYQAERDKEARRVQYERERQEWQRIDEAERQAAWDAVPEAEKRAIEAKVAAIKERRAKREAAGEINPPLFDTKRPALPDWLKTDAVEKRRADAIAKLNAMEAESNPEQETA